MANNITKYWKPSLATPLGIDWVSFRMWNHWPTLMNWLAVVSVITGVVIDPIFLLLIVGSGFFFVINLIVSDDGRRNSKGIPSMETIKKQLKHHAEYVVDYNTEPDLKSVLIHRDNCYWSPYSDPFLPQKFEQLSDKELNWIKKTWDQALNEIVQDKISTDSSYNIDEIQAFGKILGKNVQYYLNAIDELRNSDDNMSTHDYEMKQFEKELQR